VGNEIYLPKKYFTMKPNDENAKLLNKDAIWHTKKAEGEN